MYVDGVQKYFTVERPPDSPLRIPAGTYQLEACPSPKFQMLLAKMREAYPSMAGIYDVPRLVSPVLDNRDPIEIHVANTSADVEGCIGIGLTRSPDGSAIMQSQDAVADLYPKFMADIHAGIPCTIVVSDSQPVPGVEETIS
jgi:hypothetical protein